MIMRNVQAKELYLRELETKQLVRIPRKTGREVAKQLGVMVTSNGTWSKEFRNWIEFSSNMGDKLHRVRLCRMAGYLAYHSIWMAKFRYSAPVIGFTPYYLQQIQQKILGPCLSVAGYSNRFPRAVWTKSVRGDGMA